LVLSRPRISSKMSVLGHLQGPFKAPHKISGEKINTSRIKITISIFGMLIGQIKTLDKFVEGPLGTA